MSESVGVALPKSVSWKDDFADYGLPSWLFLCLVALAALHPSTAFYALVGILLITPLVLLHEWGHYRVAKKAGLGVEEFSLGFGPQVYSYLDKQGMRWSVKAIPLGGSVEIRGMTVKQAAATGTPREKAFIYATVWTRLRVMLAGVTVNYFLAWVALTVAFTGASGDYGWKAVVAAPFISLLAVAVFVGLIVQGLSNAVLRWDADVSTILSLPQGLETGVAETSVTGMPLWVYFAFVFGLLNLSVAVFNTLPLFPLDGYHVAIAVLDGARNMRASRAGQATPLPLKAKPLAVFTWTTGATLSVFLLSFFGRDIWGMLG